MSQYTSIICLYKVYMYTCLHATYVIHENTCNKHVKYMLHVLVEACNKHVYIILVHVYALHLPIGIVIAESRPTRHVTKTMAVLLHVYTRTRILACYIDGVFSSEIS